MCGFCAFYDKTKIENKKKIIKDMADRIKHRGPDSDGYYVDKDIAMGFRRLSIIDLKGGNQPLYNEDNNIVVMFNGEIYNFQELREELKKHNHIFTTNSDTEVIVHGYEEYGIDKINYYNIKTIRSSFTFDDDNKLIKTDGNEIYTFLLEKLDKFLEDYSVTDNKGKAVKTGEKRIYAPSVVFIKEGVVKKVVEGTVDSQKDPYILLNEEERKELKDKYLEGFNTLADLCDEKC